MRLVYPQLPALRWAALLTALRILLLWFSLAFTAVALIAFPTLLPVALILNGSTILIAGAAFLQSASLRCLLCRCNLFLPKTCGKHTSAQPFLGSRLLRMCLDILFTRSFACIYCGERCGCRNTPVKFAFEPSDLSYHHPLSDQYQALWQKPPCPAAHSTHQRLRDPVMRGYSPFRLLPEDEDSASLRPISSPARPQAVPASAETEAMHAKAPPPPFTTALDSWGTAYATRPGETIKSPFRELWAQSR
jgi:hypothetical protein